VGLGNIFHLTSHFSRRNTIELFRIGIQANIQKPNMKRPNLKIARYLLRPSSRDFVCQLYSYRKNIYWQCCRYSQSSQAHLRSHEVLLLSCSFFRILDYCCRLPNRRSTISFPSRRVSPHSFAVSLETDLYK